MAKYVGIDDYVDIDDSEKLIRAYNLMRDRREGWAIQLFKEGYFDAKRGEQYGKSLNDIGKACYELGQWWHLGGWEWPYFVKNPQQW